MLMKAYLTVTLLLIIVAYSVIAGCTRIRVTSVTHITSIIVIANR
ncbi:2037_t:CDS:2 [Dentiscutata erythropus]|uniref:2037_t:CDS:1 n=1 Tax=Dentiscutata erythropus TaxID=1348616 RepID=A0A9N9CUV6_9GLOM|nr:2037_t:CDS:2 [Dentiscutata erythropus]